MYGKHCGACFKHAPQCLSRARARSYGTSRFFQSSLPLSCQSTIEEPFQIIRQRRSEVEIIATVVRK